MGKYNGLLGFEGLQITGKKAMLHIMYSKIRIWQPFIYTIISSPTRILLHISYNDTNPLLFAVVIEAFGYAAVSNKNIKFWNVCQM